MTCISLFLSWHMYISYHICPRKHECLIGSIEHRFFCNVYWLYLLKSKFNFIPRCSQIILPRVAKTSQNQDMNYCVILEDTAIATVTTRSFRRTVVHSQLLMDELAQWMATAYAAFTAFECENGTAMVLQCWCCCCVLASSRWKWMPFLRIPHPRLLVQTLPKCLNRHPGCFCSTLLEENTSCFDPIHLLRCRVEKYQRSSLSARLTAGRTTCSLALHTCFRLAPVCKARSCAVIWLSFVSGSLYWDL